ncbi:MAG: nuclear transport factor 2 family protein [Chloroflexi bacterium]|mgnify:FL=1|jgi:hypothetical protein|nr:nuclear transport factor 2 family protein [Chloroflexota bacterium]
MPASHDADPRRVRTTEEVFYDHLRKRSEGEVEADIRENYAESVVMLTGTGIYRGHDGVRHTAGELEHYLPDAEFEYRTTLVEGEYAFLEWLGRSHTGKVYDGTDGFVIRDGRIVAQMIHYTVLEDDEQSGS